MPLDPQSVGRSDDHLVVGPNRHGHLNLMLHENHCHRLGRPYRTSAHPWTGAQNHRGRCRSFVRGDQTWMA